MHSTYKPILPGPPRKSGDSSPEERLPKRRRVGRQNACTACRTRKSRCDGNTPSCAFCTKRGTECFYKANRIESLQEEHQDLHDILDQLRTAPEIEAQEILQRLRATSDLSEFLASIKDGTYGRYHPPDVEDQAVSIPTLSNLEFELMAAYPTLTPLDSTLQSGLFLGPAQESPSSSDQQFDILQQPSQLQLQEVSGYDGGAGRGLETLN